MARPTKLNPELQSKIIERLQAGATVQATCDSVGIHKQTFYNWMKKGEKEKDGELFDFFDATTRAQADGLIQAAVRFRQGMNPYDAETVSTETFEETRLDKDGKPYTYRKVTTKKTIAHMPGDWRAAAEYLARRDPENWARTAPQKLEHTGAGGGAIKTRNTTVVVNAENAHDAGNILKQLADLGAIPPKPSEGDNNTAPE
jgi:transposase-like protein